MLLLKMPDTSFVVPCESLFASAVHLLEVFSSNNEKTDWLLNGVLGIDFQLALFCPDFHLSIKPHRNIFLLSFLCLFLLIFFFRHDRVF